MMGWEYDFLASDYESVQLEDIILYMFDMLRNIQQVQHSTFTNIQFDVVLLL